MTPKSGRFATSATGSGTLTTLFVLISDVDVMAQNLVQLVRVE